jgi:pimeloyl-ACP methyl ester carboxylesterase
VILLDRRCDLPRFTADQLVRNDGYLTTICRSCSARGLHVLGILRKSALCTIICLVVLFAAVLSNLGILDQSALAQEGQDQETAGEVDATNRVALPKEIVVTPPNNEVSSDSAKFSGAWAGDAWNGSTPNALVVEKVNEDGSANVIFAWGDIARRKRERGWSRIAARIADGVLSFSIPNRGTVEYSLARDGRLLGRYTYLSGRIDSVLLTRIDPVNREKIIEASQSSLPSGVVAFPVLLNSDTQETVQLRGILYRTPMPGRRPLVIFSGDSVASDAQRDRPNRAPIRARQMLGFGYSVLVLQRKGMGGSGGSFMEPRDASIPPEVQLQSALDDLDAAITFMKHQEYVDSAHIVLMGIDRGGLLSVAYAGLHDGGVAGVVNTNGSWKVRRSWWSRLLNRKDFTETQLTDAGRRTKLTMLWIYAAKESSVLEYDRSNYRAFTAQGGHGTFVELPPDEKSASFGYSAVEKEDRAISLYIQSLN